MSIRTKIIFILVAFIVVPCLLISVLVYQSARRSLTNVRMAQLESISVLKKQKIETFFDSWKKDIQAVQHNPDVRNFLPALSSGRMERHREAYRNAVGEIEEQAKAILTTYGYLNLILTDEKGRPVYSALGRKAGVLGPPEDLIDKLLPRHRKISFSPVYRRSGDGRLAIFGTGSLRDSSGRVIGAIIIERSMDEIFRFLADASGLGATGEVVLARRDGDGVLFMNPLRQDPTAALHMRIKFNDLHAFPAQQAVLGKNGMGTALDYSGQEVLAVWQFLPSLQWGLVTKIDSAEAFAPVAHLRDLIFVIMLFSLALGVLVAVVVAKGVTGPILDLQKGTEVIGSGQLDHRVGTAARDEVGQLSRLIDEMSANLNRVTARRDELDAEIAIRREAEGRIGLTNALLKLFTQKFSRAEYLDEASDLIRGWSGLRHVGIRILKPDRTIPFESCKGYNDAFLGSERTLSADADACICSRIVTGTPDPADIGAMTPNGSFFSANTMEFIANLGEAERVRYRGVCMDHGYASLAVVPVRYRRVSIGAIHLADERGGMVPAATVEFVEQMAFIIGEAVYRFGVENELRRNYDALLESENRYRRLVEDVRDVIFTLSPEGTIRSLNSAFEVLTGLRRKEWIGKHFTTLIHPEDLPAADETFQRILTGQPMPLFELRALTRTGDYRHFEFQIPAERDPEGTILGSARDVTQRKKAEEQLRLFVDLINQSSDSIYVADPGTGSILEANAAAASATGYSQHELRTMQVSDLAERQVGLEQWRKHVADLREKGALVLEDSFRRRDGSTFPVEVSVKHVMHAHKGYLIAVIRDITERKRAEEALARLVSAVEFAADAIVITDPATGVIQYVNPAYEQITGYAKDEILGRTVHFLESGKLGEEYYAGLRESLARDGFWTGRLSNRKKDGSEYIEECTVSAVKNSAGQIINYVYVKRDITEKLRLESVAESVSMMDTVGSVFAGVRHEIGNPVNSINMLLGILRGRLETLSSEDIRSYLVRMTEQIGRVEYVLRSLKSFNLFETQEPQQLGLSKFLEDFLPLVAEDVEKKGIALDAGVEGEIFAYVDPRALQQVLLNVITNAADAVREVRDPKIDISVARSERAVRIRVEDNGCGIAPEKLESIFKPFYTTKQQGTGLGLVIVRKMLTRMHGSIGVSSTPGKGTTVTIEIPEGTA